MLMRLWVGSMVVELTISFMWMRVGSLIWMMVCGGVARLKPWPSGIAGDVTLCGDAIPAARMAATSRPTCASMRLALGS